MKSLQANYFGKNRVLENCKKVSMKDLLKIVKERLKHELMNIELEGVTFIQTKTNY